MNMSKLLISRLAPLSVKGGPCTRKGRIPNALSDWERGVWTVVDGVLRCVRRL